MRNEIQNLFSFKESILFREWKEHFGSGIIKRTFTDLIAITDGDGHN